MIASAYIKDGNIFIFNENQKFTDVGGVSSMLGGPLLDFICCDARVYSLSTF
jgi:hypothetical protein